MTSISVQASLKLKSSQRVAPQMIRLCNLWLCPGILAPKTRHSATLILFYLKYRDRSSARARPLQPVEYLGN